MQKSLVFDRMLLAETTDLTPSQNPPPITLSSHCASVAWESQGVVLTITTILNYATKHVLCFCMLHLTYSDTTATTDIFATGAASGWAGLAGWAAPGWAYFGRAGPGQASWTGQAGLGGPGMSPLGRFGLGALGWVGPGAGLPRASGASL